MTEKAHYWLFASMVFFKAGAEAEVATAYTNVILATTEQYINSAALGKVNQLAQHQAVATHAIPEGAEVVNVVITSANFIGTMTSEEFALTTATVLSDQQVTIRDENGNVHDAAALLATDKNGSVASGDGSDTPAGGDASVQATPVETGDGVVGE